MAATAWVGTAASSIAPISVADSAIDSSALADASGRADHLAVAADADTADAAPDAAVVADATSADAVAPSGPGPCPAAAICLDKFPFSHKGDTELLPPGALSAYACKPSANESGPPPTFLSDGGCVGLGLTCHGGLVDGGLDELVEF